MVSRVRKRRSPRQHTRRLQSGRKTIVSKGNTKTKFSIFKKRITIKESRRKGIFIISVEEFNDFFKKWERKEFAALKGPRSQIEKQLEKQFPRHQIID